MSNSFCGEGADVGVPAGGAEAGGGIEDASGSVDVGAGSLVFLVVARLLQMEEMNSGLVRRVLNLLRIPWL